GHDRNTRRKFAMKKDFIAGIVLAGLLAFSAARPAQAAQQAGSKAIPRTPDGRPDLSGIWKTVNSKADPVQLTAWGADRFDYNKLPKGNGARHELDPILNCYRPGLARLGPPLVVPADGVAVRLEDEAVPAPGGPAFMDAIMILYSPRIVWMLYQYDQEI